MQSPNELTMGEVSRRLGHIEGKLDARVVFRDVYEAQRQADLARIKDLEEWQKWAQRAIAGAFVSIGVQVIVVLILLALRLR